MAKPTDWESRIGRRVRLRDLHALSAVIQSGSMAKAAKELGVTQSAVSQMIADLEAALRVRLLDRSPRGVVPTIYGDILLKRSRAALDEIKHGIEEIEFLTDHATGQVRVGCPESISSAVLPPIAELFLQRFPRATLDVDDVNFGALAPLLQAAVSDERKSDAAGPESPAAAAAVLDKAYEILLDALGFEPAGVDTLVERTGFAADEVASMLLILELDGKLETRPGGRYLRRVLKAAK